VFAVFVAGASVALALSGSPARAAQENSEASRMFSGVLTDSICGARHDRNLDKSPAECVRYCVRNGASYVLVNGDKRYEIGGSRGQLSKFAGQRVTIEGALDGDAISAFSIKAAD
jgi:hypothetical protein